MILFLFLLKKMWFYNKALKINKGRETARKAFWVSLFISLVYSIVCKGSVAPWGPPRRNVVCSQQADMWKEPGGTHTYHLKTFVLLSILSFWWPGCCSFRKWDCPSAFYKNSEVIFPLQVIFGRENGNGRKEYAFFEGSGIEWQPALLVVYRNVSVTEHINTEFMTKSVEWKNQWLDSERNCHNGKIPRLTLMA